MWPVYRASLQLTIVIVVVCGLLLVSHVTTVRYCSQRGEQSSNSRNSAEFEDDTEEDCVIDARPIEADDYIAVPLLPPDAEDKWYNKCPSTASHAALFVAHDVVDLYGHGHDGPIVRPSIHSCESCSAGTQYLYAGKRGPVAYDDVEAKERPAIGDFTCDDPLNLCVEGFDGRKYRAVANMSVRPVPFCEGDHCFALAHFMQIDGSQAVAGIVEVEGEGRQIAVNEQAGRTSDDYTFIKVRGLTCNGCRSATPFCDRSPRTHVNKRIDEPTSAKNTTDVVDLAENQRQVLESAHLTLQQILASMGFRHRHR